MQNQASPQTPELSFANLGISAALKAVLEELGFAHMTPIQAQSIPILLEGHDLIGQSKTGSGKTAAFSLPILDRLHINQHKVQALIVCPTRELSAQVVREIRRLGRRHAGLKVLALTGGEPLREQTKALMAGVHVVVGTPGRLNDHLRRNNLELNTLRYLVLDEADRMLDMGFQDDVEQILDAAPKNRQTILFSATFPASIEAISERFQNQAQRVTIEEAPEAKSPIEQLLVEISLDQKLSALHSVMSKYQPETSIIFANQKILVDEITAALAQWGVSAASLHGDLEQIDREKVMAQLRNKSLRAIVATDVAARGIDVAGLEMVVNFDLPLKTENYIHRIGRTGRAGRKGLAISFASKRDSHKIIGIEEAIGCELRRLKLDLNQATSRGTTSHEALYQGAAMMTLTIGGGRKDKLRPGDILGALTGEAGGLDGDDIGKIEIHDRIAYVAVARTIGKIAVERLRQGRIKGRKFDVQLSK